MSLPNSRKASAELPPLSTMTTTVTIPEKTALSNATTICTPVERSPRPSSTFVPTLDKPGANPFETDLEMAPTTTTSDKITWGQKDTMNRRSDCRVWPGKDHWKQKAKAAKRKRSWCTCMAGLSRRNRIIARVLIVFLIIGIAIGVGFGVSKPLGAPIWH